MRYRHGKTIALRGFLTLCITLGFMGCAEQDGPGAAAMNETRFRPDGILDFMRPDSSIIARIVIEIAESAQAQARGLMYRRSLPDRGGMLFVDAEPSLRSFWMKNTPIALDIIFVDAQGDIINIVTRTTPFSEDRILSSDSAQYVVEVRAGFVERHRISSADHISWERRTFETTQ